ncbi:acyl-CoA dehydrogenase family protein [Burkholderia cenocepacia]
MSEVDQVKDEAFYAAFRQKIADYIEANVPAEVRAATRANRKLGRELLSRYTAAMAKGGLGYSAPGWTKEFGGPGWDVMQRLIFEEVTAAMDCPQLYHHGIGHIGPVIQAFGTDAQKARFLPPIIDGSEWWCQGYSEPGAGSTSRPSRPPRFWTKPASITSSTARRSGPRTRRKRTSCIRSCERATQASPRKASRCC